MAACLLHRPDVDRRNDLLFQILNGYPVNGAVLIPLALLFVGWALIYKKRDRT